jgi:GntR family transcriptional regulator, transcriptional repressor for pyruvate dehydrogenase complex
MQDKKQNSITDTAATRLRAVIAAREDGDFLGDEGDVQKILSVSRTTLRQVARLLEREGLLAVRRGGNGGYFARRPSLGSVETALIAHLETLDVGVGELLAIASITWTESVEQAARLRSEKSRALAGELAALVRSIGPAASNQELIEVEQGIRSQIFELIESPYLRLIFQVNVQFAQRKFEGPGKIPPRAQDHEDFVAAWRDSKLLELTAIAQGDVELGTLAAKRTRSVWTRMMQGAGNLAG